MNFAPSSPSPSAFLSREILSAQIILFNETVRPYRLHQNVLFQQTAGLLNEHQQQIECFRSQRNTFAIAQQQTFFWVQAKGPEFV